MDIRLPHEIIYETPELVPIADVIESLRGNLLLTQELGPLLEALIPGLTVERLSLTITEISQASPLREAFAVGLVALYQEKLGADVPKIVQDIFGAHLPMEYDNLVSLAFIVLMFYGGLFVFTHAGSIVERGRIKRQFADLVAEIAAMLDTTEDQVMGVLSGRYATSKRSALRNAVSRILRPSKNQSNSAVVVSRHRIERDTVSEFPSDAQILDDDPGLTSASLENVEIHLRAQDIDHNKQGWAALVPAVSPHRIRMHLYPPIKPADIYTKQIVHGDVLVESRRNEDGITEPTRVHLIRLRE